MADITAWLASTGVLLLDGAMGTELKRRGVSTPLPLWSAHGLLHAPDIVLRIHRDYVAAGADALITNTFRTTRRALAATAAVAAAIGADTAAIMNVEPRELVALAVALARRAAVEAGRQVYVLGSMAPLEDCYRPDLVPGADTLAREHAEHAANLAEAGVDALILETMNTEREALAALAAARATGLPVLASFVANAEGALYDGSPLSRLIPALIGGGACAVLVNCTPAATTDRIVPVLRDLCGSTPFGAYANMGYPHPVDGFAPAASMTAADYAAHAAKWVASGARLIGGCCGTAPEHIAAIRDRLGR
jgi:S-methylmethionine-dependent homocysteine/selenocysteine methylase